MSTLRPARWWLVLALAVICGIAGGAEPTQRSAVDRVNTLEDIYGDTGDTFQAALGFVNFEGTPAQVAFPSYGLAVDDMVVKWREFTLESDETDCAVTSSAHGMSLRSKAWRYLPAMSCFSSMLRKASYRVSSTSAARTFL